MEDRPLHHPLTYGVSGLPTQPCVGWKFKVKEAASKNSTHAGSGGDVVPGCNMTPDLADSSADVGLDSEYSLETVPPPRL